MAVRSTEHARSQGGKQGLRQIPALGRIGHGRVTAVKVYVAGPLAATARVRAIQEVLVAAGHELTLDWTRGSDAAFVEDYASELGLSAKISANDLDATLEADAVLVVMSEHEGRGMYVELGAALARARRGDLQHVVVLGPIQHESVFYYHPAVQRVASVEEWLVRLS